MSIILEEARKSLDDFLHQKENFDQLRGQGSAINPHGSKLNELARQWLETHPEYHDYFLQLDIEWTGTSGISGYLWDYSPCMCCHAPPKGPHAKNFRVITRDWEDERFIHRKGDEKLVKRQQVAAAREALNWEL